MEVTGKDCDVERRQKSGCNVAACRAQVQKPAGERRAGQLRECTPLAPARWMVSRHAWAAETVACRWLLTARRAGCRFAAAARDGCAVAQRRCWLRQRARARSLATRGAQSAAHGSPLHPEVLSFSDLSGVGLLGEPAGDAADDASSARAAGQVALWRARTARRRGWTRPPSTRATRRAGGATTSKPRRGCGLIRGRGHGRERAGAAVAAVDAVARVVFVLDASAVILNSVSPSCHYLPSVRWRLRSLWPRWPR